jgi:hypothetical protein
MNLPLWDAPTKKVKKWLLPAVLYHLLLLLPLLLLLLLLALASRAPLIAAKGQHNEDENAAQKDQCDSPSHAEDQSCATYSAASSNYQSSCCFT